MSRPWPPNTIAVPLVLALVAAWDGGGYLLGPAAWSSSPSLAAFDGWPGGIRTYGALLIATAAVLAAGLLGRSLHVVRIGEAAFIACLLANAASILASWSDVGIAAWGGPTKGLGLAALAVCILRRTPDLPRE